MTKRFFSLLMALVLLFGALGATPAYAIAESQPQAAEAPSLLQFTSGGHALGFANDGMYAATGSHALHVNFINANRVQPQAANAAASTGGSIAPLNSVTYADLWPGISLNYTAVGGDVYTTTYSLVPGADANDIQLRYNAPLRLNENGTLTIAFEDSSLTESAPIAWQEMNGKRVNVDVAFSLSGGEMGENEVSFALGKYNPRYPLTIDPTLEWNTFLGGSGLDVVRSIALDGSGNVYVSGSSYLTWGSPLRAFAGGSDAFVAKLDSSGALQWHTFLGWSGYDDGSSTAVDGNGNVYVSGQSEVTWGSPLRAHSGNGDAFIAKLDSSGSLIWNTFLGGNGSDGGFSIAVDDGGNIYVGGSSGAAWGSPLREYAGNDDAFVAKLDSSGALTWNTFLGGSGADGGSSIVVDSSGNVYVVGGSSATWGSPLRAHSGGGYDAFAAKLGSAGNLQWNTFLGGSDGSGFELGMSIAVDGSGNVYVSGDSPATWGSPLRAYTAGYTAGLGDAFVAKLDSSGALLWNTFLGGSGGDSGNSIAVDGSGNVYVGGSSDTTWGSPVQAHTGDNDDAFAAKLDPSGTLVWHSFLGGSGDDRGRSIAVDGSERVYIGGYSTATWGSPLRAYAGDYDVFVAKIDGSPAPEMELKQDVTPIADGGSQGFGSHVAGSDTDLIFTIENTGTADLILTTPISIGGADADHFSIQAQPDSPVAASGSTTFTVRFTPTSDGAKTANLSIANNDSDENPYDLTITGTGSPLATYTLSGNAGTAGANLTYTGGSTAADADGNYAFIVDYGWTGTVTPTKAGYTFTPSSRSYTNLTVDQTGQDYVAHDLADDFVIKVKTDNSGVSSSTQFTIPTTGSGYNYNVDCNNDGVNEATAQTGNYTCNYAAAGTYTLRIIDNTGVGTGFPRIYFNYGGDKLKLLTIEQWGRGKWTSMAYAFSGCANLAGQASDSPDLSGVTDLSYMFASASGFNQNIGSWNTSNVTNLRGMFINARVFNQNIGGWNTTNVTNMSYMFYGASGFNQNIGSWNTANVTDMNYMFYEASAFNQPIGNWNTAKVTKMYSMFYKASAFNQPIGNWNTANVTTMYGMFNEASAFNQPIGNWNTASVTDMGSMFWKASAFNQPIGNWNTANVTSMNFMFNNASAFNQPIESWNTVKVTIMSSMFSGASAFNQPIGNWNTANVMSINFMFNNASAFNQNLGSWNVGALTSARSMFSGVTLSTPNYDALLNGWNAQTLRSDVTFSGGDSLYCLGDAARTNLIISRSWSITDGGKSCPSLIISGNTGIGSATLTYTGGATTTDDSGDYAFTVSYGWTGTITPAKANYIFTPTSITISNPIIANLTGQDFTVIFTPYTISGNAGIGGATLTYTGGSTTADGDGNYSFAVPNDWTGTITPSKTGYTFTPVFITVSTPVTANLTSQDFTATFNPYFISGNVGMAGATLTYTGGSTAADADGNYAFIVDYGWTGTVTPTKAGYTFTPSSRSYTNLTVDQTGQDYVAHDLADDFVIKVKTDNSGVSSSTQFTIPTTGSGYNYNVDCNNDGVNEATAQTGSYTCNYAAVGTYTLRIQDNSGLGTGFPWIYFNNGGDRLKLLTIEQWGRGKWTSMAYAFYGCANLAGPASDSPDLSGVTDLSYMFRGASAFNQNIGSWNTASVTNLRGMFYGASAFNQNIGSWNTANVTDMSEMFISASVFNQPLVSWDTTKVTNMSGMFAGASAFNQPIGDWNTASVTNLSNLFSRASAFNQPIGDWNTASVTNMSGIFAYASAFNRPLDSWDTSKVTNMSAMFHEARLFNQSIGGWNTASVTNMSNMFYSASAFNQDIGGWNTAKVTDMNFMFGYTSVFNQPIGNWNTASVTNMSYMFQGALAFNQPIGTWNTAKVTNMGNMFWGASAFNQDIGSWDITKVTNLSGTFAYASDFNQPIGSWNTAKVTDMSYMFYNANPFNQPIESWNTASVTNMSYMFRGALAFNQPIGTWNTAKVTDLSYMFSNASVFNQNLGGWNIGALISANNMFDGVTLSTPNYDALLNGWDAQTLRSGVTFSGGNSQYCFGGSARNHLITARSWTITDGGRSWNCFTISGNTGIGGATLTYTGGSTTADGNGNYAFTVNYGWSGAVTPSKMGYTFAPASRNYVNISSDQTAQNYTPAPVTTHVKPNGLATNGCGETWTTACDLQYALTNAVSGNELWVAAGTYKPTNGAGRTTTFQLKSGVAVYGGFTGTETTRDQRDPATNITVLSGDLNGNDNDNVAYDEPTRAENSYHVVTGATGATLDGFTIKAGNANGRLADKTYVGGGIYNNGSSPTLTNITFSVNSAISGGGMYNYGGSPMLTNVTFSENSGSGMLNSSSNPVLTNVTFSGNSGSGMTNSSSNPVLTNVTFSGNSAQYGGGMYNSFSIPQIRNTLFWGNTATTSGAQIYNSSSTPTVSDSVVQGGCPAGSTCTNIITIDPLLGTLGSYGGYTQTIPLLTGSSAIDTGNDTVCPSSDQRGVTRPQGAQCDIGAYETVDPTAPIVTAFTATSPANSLNIPITAFTATDNVGVTGYLITESTTAPGAGDAGWTGSVPATYTVASDGSYTLYPWAKDAAGNVSAVFGTPVSVLVDSTSPSVVSIVRMGASPTSAASVDFTVTFSEAVTGVNAADFALTATGSISEAAVTGISGAGITYTVTASTGTGAGTLRLDVPATATIEDLAGNPLSGLPYTSGEAYTIELPIFGKTAPIDSATGQPLSPTLSWSTSDGATSYEYCYSSAPGPCTKWNPVGSDTSVTLSGLAPNYTYYWQARAVNAGGSVEADDGTWWSFTTTAASACAWPPYTPPATPTFGDVPMDAGHWSWVERLANSTITAGCGAGNYCPFNEVNRAQMAIFLLRGKHCGGSYTPPAVGDSTGFADVLLYASYAPWVKQLAAEGVTAGCGNGNFCPLQVVNRAQMAIFLLRAKHGATYSPPAVGASTGFGDVPLDASYAAWVKQLAAEGVTAGCGNGNFCPLQNVNRAQMATFLVRAFGLP